MAFITVDDLFTGMRSHLKLTLFTPKASLERKIRSAEIHRPGLAFSGFYDYFAYDCVQVLGKTEIKFLQRLKGIQRKRNLNRFFSYKIPCVIVAKNQSIPKDFLDLAVRAKVPVFRSFYRTSTCVSQITVFIEQMTAPETGVHGTLVDVYGVGMLLMGLSGIGKSECALSLIDRGHRLVADDVVLVKREGQLLTGRANETLRHHMEIRGIGIIDIKGIFGVRAIRNQKRIALVVSLESWSRRREYERTGLEQRKYNLLGVALPHFIIPVRPGRNIPTLLEAAALTQRSRLMGEHFAGEFNNKLIRKMAPGVLNRSD